MTTTLPPHLRPDMHGSARGLWRAAARGELQLPRCTECTAFTWPPKGHCPVCGSNAIEWMRSSGRGVVYTFTVVRQAADPYFQAKVPYVVAMIELDEGARVMSNIAHCDVETVHINMPVAVTFVEAGDGLVVPVFTPTGAATR